MSLATHVVVIVEVIFLHHLIIQSMKDPDFHVKFIVKNGKANVKVFTRVKKC